APGEGGSQLRRRRARPAGAMMDAGQLEADEGLDALEQAKRLGELVRRGGQVAVGVQVQAAERQVRERAAWERDGALVGGLRVRDLAAHLVCPSDALPDVARMRIEIAGLAEGRERGVEVALAERQFSLAGAQMLHADG